MIKHTENRALIIWILGALATVSPFAIDLYLPAFSEIAGSFNTTSAKISLSVTSYFIGMAMGQMLYGPLLDRYGRKRPLYIGLLVFITSSIGCAQSGSVEELVAFRFIQALGGSVAWVAAVAMVRDFFPVSESAKIFSLLVLILGVSPLLAPTLGGFITTAIGWQGIFIVLAVIVTLIVALVFIYLPEGHPPDPTISLRAKPMLATFFSVLRHPQFYTYTFSGAFSFATLFIYVAGSPVIFMDIFKISPQAYGGIFALLSVGFIGGSQFNIYLTRRYKSDKILRFTLVCQVVASVVFLIGTWNDWFGLYATIVMFFSCLTCIGLINPNATALALAPFTRNVGSASALLGCTQIGVAALASGGVGVFDSSGTIPIVALMTITSLIALLVLWIGQAKIGAAVTVDSVVKDHVGH